MGGCRSGGLAEVPGSLLHVPIGKDPVADLELAGGIIFLTWVGNSPEIAGKRCYDQGFLGFPA